MKEDTQQCKTSVKENNGKLKGFWSVKIACMHLLTTCKIRNINIILRNPYCFWQKSNSEHGLYKFSVVQSVSQEQCHGHADNLVQVKYSINSKYQMLILRSNVKDQTSLDIDVF